MNIHFFVSSSNNSSNSVFHQALANNIKINYSIFSEKINLRYKRRIWLYLVGWPHVLFSAFRRAILSLLSVRKPDWVVLENHFQVLTYTILSKFILFNSQKPKLMLLGFIYTNRQSKLLSNFKKIYFTKILGWSHCIICHSIQEVDKNVKYFNLINNHFAYIPYGMHVYRPEQDVFNNVDYAVSAGRSGRDYALLIQCFTLLGYPLRIICDSFTAIPENQNLPKNIQVLRQCYDEAY